MAFTTDKELKNETPVIVGILVALMCGVFLLVFGVVRHNAISKGTVEPLNTEPLVIVSTGLECDTVTVGSQWVWTNPDPFAKTIGDITSVTIEVIEINGGYALTQYIEPKRKYLSSKNLNDFGRYKKVGCE